MKLYQENQRKVRVLKAIILIALLGVFYLLTTSCEKTELVEPKQEFIDLEQGPKDDPLFNWDEEPEPESWHKMWIKEFGLTDTTDTIIHYNGWARPTWRWQAEGFDVQDFRDTSYSLLPDSVQANWYFQVTFKVFDPFAD